MMASPQDEALTALGRLHLLKQEPGYQELLRRLRYLLDMELAALYAEGGSPGHRLDGPVVWESDVPPPAEIARDISHPAGVQGYCGRPGEGRRP